MNKTPSRTKNKTTNKYQTNNKKNLMKLGHMRSQANNMILKQSKRMLKTKI